MAIRVRGFSVWVFFFSSSLFCSLAQAVTWQMLHTNNFECASLALYMHRVLLLCFHSVLFFLSLFSRPHYYSNTDLCFYFILTTIIRHARFSVKKFVSMYLRFVFFFQFDFFVFLYLVKVVNVFNSYHLLASKEEKKKIPWDYYISLIIFYYNFLSTYLSDVRLKEKKAQVNCTRFLFFCCAIPFAILSDLQVKFLAWNLYAFFSAFFLIAICLSAFIFLFFLDSYSN